MWSASSKIIRHTHTARSMLKWAAAQRVWSRQSWITHTHTKLDLLWRWLSFFFWQRIAASCPTDLWCRLFETQTLWLVFFPSESARLSCTKKWTTTADGLLICCVSRSLLGSYPTMVEVLSPSIGWMNAGALPNGRSLLWVVINNRCGIIPWLKRRHGSWGISGNTMIHTARARKRKKAVRQTILLNISWYFPRPEV